MEKPVTAAILSAILPGVGQMYNDEAQKGIVIMVAYFVSALMMLVLIGFITTPIIYVYGIIDAYRTADNKQQEK